MWSFKIENGNVKMYKDGVPAGTLGTILPNDEHITRVIARAFAAGQEAKLRELREFLGVRER